MRTFLKVECEVVVNLGKLEGTKISRKRIAADLSTLKRDMTAAASVPCKHTLSKLALLAAASRMKVICSSIGYHLCTLGKRGI